MNGLGSGMIQGGWEYVWAGYALTAVTLILYSLSLYLRWPRAGASRNPPPP